MRLWSVIVPKIQIDMKKGFCAGLVASKENVLRFPRSIVQILGREQFVVSDMGGWQRTDGRLLLLDPHAAEGKRIREAVTDLNTLSDWQSARTRRSTHRRRI